MERGPGRNRLWQIVGISFVVIVVILLFRQLIVGWPAVRAFPWRWRWEYLIGSFVAMQIGYLTMARAWRSVLRAIRVRLHYRTAYWIFFISNLGRYLPGKVWQIGAAAVFGKRLGFSGRDMVASMIVYQLYIFPLGAMLALSWGHLPAPYDRPAFQWTAWLVALVAGAAAVWPHIALRVVGPLARKLEVDPERWKLELIRRLAIAVQSAFVWLCTGIGFALFVMAVTPIGIDRMVELGRAYVAAYVIGYVALIAPGGLGVREAAITILLQPVLGSGPAAGLALLSRVWVTLSELMAVAPALWWAKRERTTTS